MSRVSYFDGQINLDFISFLKAEPNGLLWEEVTISCSVMLNVNKSTAQKDAMGTKQILVGTEHTHVQQTHARAWARTHMHTHTHTHVLQFIGGMKKNATLEKNATVWVKTEFLANRLVIYKFISLRHYHCFLTFVQEAR